MNKICLQDTKLSWKAKGIYSYLMSLPSDWTVKTSEVVKHSNDGRTALLSGLKELIEKGYCELRENRNEQGSIISYDYVLKESPDVEIPSTDYPLTENPLAGNQPLLNNNRTNIESTNNLLAKKPSKGKKKKTGIFNPNTLGGKLAQKLLDKIELSDPLFQTPNMHKWEKYFNKMIYVDGYGYDLLDNLIEFAHNKSFWKAIIISPYKLKANISTLKIQIRTLNNYSKNRDKDVFEQAKQKGLDISY